jgi:hypothetical protein
MGSYHYWQMARMGPARPFGVVMRDTAIHVVAAGLAVGGIVAGLNFYQFYHRPAIDRY